MLEIGHDVAHRGGRQAHRQQTADIARSDRLAGLEIALDNAPEDLAGALVDPGKAGGLGGAGKGRRLVHGTILAPSRPSASSGLYRGVLRWHQAALFQLENLPYAAVETRP